MEKVPFPEDLRRFVLTSIPSVPFLEALLLLRAAPDRHWHADTLARRLYVGERTAQALLQDLCRAGMVAPDETTFAYLKGRPHAPEGADWDAAVEAWRARAAISSCSILA